MAGKWSFTLDTWKWGWSPEVHRNPKETTAEKPKKLNIPIRRPFYDSDRKLLEMTPCKPQSVPKVMLLYWWRYMILSLKKGKISIREAYYIILTSKVQKGWKSLKNLRGEPQQNTKIFETKEDGWRLLVSPRNAWKSPAFDTGPNSRRHKTSKTEISANQYWRNSENHQRWSHGNLNTSAKKQDGKVFSFLREDYEKTYLLAQFPAPQNVNDQPLGHSELRWMSEGRDPIGYDFGGHAQSSINCGGSPFLVF